MAKSMQSTSTKLASVAATRQVAAGASDDAYIVGTKNDRESDAAKQRATSVIHEFDFGDIEQIVAGRFPEESREALRKNSKVRYVEGSWDTTAVSDGDYTLDATATDSAGNTSGLSISVMTDNTEDTDSAPTTDSFALTDNSNPAWTRYDVD